MDLLQKLKQYDVNIWVYTGFLFEEIDKQYLQYIDVLVDGPFILSQKSLALFFKGSANQRIIDVQKSLLQNKIILMQVENG